MSAIFLRYVRPDEMWSRTATITATSAATGYPATNAASDDPAKPWQATSGTATLTVTLSGSLEVGVAALIQSNTDQSRTVTIGGGLSGMVTGDQGADGYPRNLAFVPALAGAISSVTAAVAGNSANWAVGEIVVGKLRSMAFPIFPGASRGRQRAVIDDTNPDFNHTIRYDLGATQWSMSGKSFADDAELANLIAWWESTRGGTLPTLILPNLVDSEPRLVRMEAIFTHSNDGAQQHHLDLKFIEIARGLRVT